MSDETAEKRGGRKNLEALNEISLSRNDLVDHIPLVLDSVRLPDIKQHRVHFLSTLFFCEQKGAETRLGLEKNICSFIKHQFDEMNFVAFYCTQQRSES